MPKRHSGTHSFGRICHFLQALAPDLAQYLSRVVCNTLCMFVSAKKLYRL